MTNDISFCHLIPEPTGRESGRWCNQMTFPTLGGLCPHNPPSSSLIGTDQNGHYCPELPLNREGGGGVESVGEAML